MKYLKRFTLVGLCAIITLLSTKTNAQEFSAGINTETPNPNAVLHLVAPNGDQGLLIPSLTTAERTSMTLTAADNGLMVFDSDDNAFYFWVDPNWVLTTNTDNQNLANVLGQGNDAGGVAIINVANPVNPQDVATKDYVDNQGDLDDQDLELTGTTLSLTNDPTSIDLTPFLDNTDNQNLSSVLASGNDAGAIAITNLPTPTTPADAATKSYVDSNAGLTTVTSVDIVDGEIANADINAGANISWSKIDKTGANVSEFTNDLGFIDAAANPTALDVSGSFGTGLQVDQVGGATAVDIAAASAIVNGNPNLDLDSTDDLDLTTVPNGAGDVTGDFGTGLFVDFVGGANASDIAGATATVLGNPNLDLDSSDDLTLVTPPNAAGDIAGDFSGGLFVDFVGGEAATDIASATFIVNNATALDVDATDDLVTGSNISLLTNDLGYIATEADPIWTADRTTLGTIGTINAGANLIDWSQLKGVPTDFADGVDDGIATEADPIWTADRTTLGTIGTINAGANLIDWSQLKGVPTDFADGVDDGIATEADPIWTADRTTLGTIGTINAGANLIDWSQLKGVPTDFADGVDDGIATEADPIWTADRTTLGTIGTINAGANLIDWSQLKGVPTDFADGVDDGIATEADPIWTADRTTLGTIGTINAGANLIDWSQLKGVPTDFADGVDDGIATEADPIWTADRTTLGTIGTINAGANLIDWSQLKGVPTDFADGVDDGIATEADPVWTADRTTLGTIGTINAGANLIDWSQLKGVPTDFADGVDDGIATEADPVWTADRTTLGTIGTINAGANLIDWSQLKGVPTDFADGVDDLGGDMFASVYDPGGVLGDAFDLSNHITFTPPADGEVLTWDNTNLRWDALAVPVTGDMFASVYDPGGVLGDAFDLSNHITFTPPADGEVLTWDNTNLRWDALAVPVTGDMFASVYDPGGVLGDAFDLSNHITFTPPADGEVLTWDNTNLRWDALAVPVTGDMFASVYDPGGVLGDAFDLSNHITFTPPADGEVLTWDNTNLRWDALAVPVTGDMFASIYDPGGVLGDAFDLSNHITFTPPADGEVLTWDNTNLRWDALAVPVTGDMFASIYDPGGVLGDAFDLSNHITFTPPADGEVLTWDNTNLRWDALAVPVTGDMFASIYDPGGVLGDAFDLSNHITFTPPADGEVLTWDNTNLRWDALAVPVTGDMFASIYDPGGVLGDAFDLSNHITFTPPADGEVLTWDNTNLRWDALAVPVTGDMFASIYDPGGVLGDAFDLSNHITFTPPADGEVLTWDNTNLRWDALAVPVTGDMFASIYDPGGVLGDAFDLSNHITFTPPADGEVLTWDNTNLRWDAMAPPSIFVSEPNATSIVGGTGAAPSVTGGNNTVYGVNAGNSLIGGLSNTLIGSNAGQGVTGSNNTMIGDGAGSNTTGNENILIGRTAGNINTTGSSNTFIGTGAGNGNLGIGNTSGSSITLLGYFADTGVDGLTNATAIGQRAVVGSSNSLVLGGTGAESVNVGIGTTTPTVSLDITATDAIRVPKGNDLARPTGLVAADAGLFRYSEEPGAEGFEGYDGTIWKKIGGAVTGTAFGIPKFNSTGDGIEDSNLFSNASNDQITLQSIATNSPDFIIHDTGLGDASMQFNRGGVAFFAVGIDQAGSDNFKISSGATVGTDEFVIDRISGNVGLGIGTPSRELHLHNGVGGISLQLTNSASAGTGANNGFVIDYNNADQTVNFRHYENANIALGSNSTQNLFIDNTNNRVGIGTATPSAQLDVNGNVSIAANTTISNTGDIEHRGNLVSIPDAIVRSGVFTVLSRVVRINAGVPSLNPGLEGQEVILIAVAGLTVSHGVNILLNGAIDFVMNPNSTLHLLYDGTNWLEIGRSQQ